MDRLKESQGSPEVHRQQTENHQHKTYSSPRVMQIVTYS